MKHSIRVLVRVAAGLKFLMRVKEVKDGSILYSFPPLDGRTRPRLVGEVRHKVEPGPRKYRYEDFVPVGQPMDHISLHTTGRHHVAPPPGQPASTGHWGVLRQHPLRPFFDWQAVGIVLPSDLSRFPDGERFDPNQDHQIDLVRLGIDYLSFKICLIGRRLQRDRIEPFGVPAEMVNPQVTTVSHLFKGIRDWFFLPLDSYTLVFLIHDAARPSTIPPHITFCRWEPDPGGLAHVAYLE